MYKKYDVVIIGGGIFGCLCAIELSKLNKKVILLEQKNNLMSGATLNNQNRLHLGYHYPRDINTALQCQKGFKIFANEYSDCILGGIQNLYCLSNSDSKVNLNEYREFCKKVKLPFNEIESKELPEQIKNVQCIINTEEVIYDCKELSQIIKKKLDASNVSYKLNSRANHIKELDNGFSIDLEDNHIQCKAVVNATYSNYNLFHNILGLKKRKYQYELTLVPIIKWRSTKPPLGITLMDGNFFSILPFGKSGLYLLYHVEHSVFKRKIAEIPPISWDNPKEIINSEIAEQVFEKMINDISNWLPSIKEAKFVDYLTTTRIVLSKVDDTDARPSLIEEMPLKNCFINLFSGKIDHAIWVSKEISNTVVTKISKDTIKI